ncbi:pilus assembly protein [Acinetobacter haemolyticus]|uniref:hypothetical protein n=1 Tax=Acinetobacter haemolyticus TaxID=29430 RepID=UPI000DE84D2C|nr:hypothetical protein [Acinetobacter haemolyticus]WHR56695.1 hypothetical protein PGW89_09510 [Acinetobacter haemolyticus]
MKMLNKKTVHLNDAQADMQHNDWLNKLKVGTITAATTSLICVSAASHAADLEIYVSGNNVQSATTIMFLLDISGSMDTRSIEQDYGTICERNWQGRVVFEGTAVNGQYCTASGSEITNQIIKDCEKSGNNYKCYDRISRLRQGMLAVLEGDNEKGVAALNDDLVIGLSTLGAYTTTYHEAGAIKVPARALKDSVTVSSVTKTQRALLIEEIKKLRGQTNTPTTRSYAEAVAYLMGSTTEVGNGEWYFGGTYNKQSIYAECISMNATGKCTSWGNVFYGNVPSGFTKGTATTAKGYSGNVYVASKKYSGFEYSDSSSKNTAQTLYLAPNTISRQKDLTDDEKSCNGQGIYILTDGVPNYGNGTSGLIAKALGNKGDGFSCTDSSSGWDCTLQLAETILDSTKNPANIAFKTAVVGFGSDFNSISSSVQTEAAVDALTGIDDNVKQAAKWGIRGKGGWYSGSNASDVASSIEDFVNKNSGEIPSISTGSSMIPIDALNPEIIQPYAYFPQFEPKVKAGDLQQLWFGNVKKYYVVNNSVYSNKNGGAANTVVLKSELQDLRDIWGAESASYPENTPIYQKYGALSKLKLGTQTFTDGEESTTTAGRKVLTDYVFDGTKSVDQQISRNFDLSRIDYTYTTDAKTKNDDASRVRGLMSLLGYNIPTATDTNGLDLATMTATLRQMGSVYHSLPVLLTQEGKAEATRDAAGKIHIGTTGREDYVMFGTTQGLLSVVDAETGIEKFSFVPKEMIEKQYETFKENAGSLTGGKEALYYGMDGEWAAHTVYVTKPDGTLTVKEAVRNVIGTEEDKENFKGKQWVYGGMRMGGRSYYALDLTDIDNPALKFHIDPSSGKVYSKDYPEGKAFSVIENMGQSWSKPKLDYVNWKGQRKLVMFVGGGYDAGGNDGDGLWVDGVRTGYAGYEHYDYQQENRRGAGVYMFDADNGDLLWYANTPADSDAESESSAPTTDPSTPVEAIPHISHSDLKYSVVSEIKTVDRNNDGMVDHIYFGDLAGQAFRVDFARSTTKFDSQITKILDVHQTDGTSPRFYLAPVFTAHHSSDRLEGANVVVVSFVSGNKSSPLLATSDSPEATGKRNSTGLQYDAVYAIYDYDIHPNGQFYPDSNITARTLATTTDTTATTTKLMYIGYDSLVRKDQADGNNRTRVMGAIANSTTGWGGWYFRFDKKFSATGQDHVDADESVIKGLAPLIAMEGSLYVTMYDASEDGTSSRCGAGVKGQSFAQRLCLPTGVCAEDANYSYNLGAGIVSLNVGSVSGGSTKSIVVPDRDDVGKGCVGADCKAGKKFIEAGGSMRFIPNRWYERYAKK